MLKKFSKILLSLNKVLIDNAFNGKILRLLISGSFAIRVDQIPVKRYMCFKNCEKVREFSVR